MIIFGNSQVLHRQKVAPQLALSPAMITALPLTIVDKSLAIAVTVVWHLGQ